MQEIFEIAEMTGILIKMMLVDCGFPDDGPTDAEFEKVIRWATHTPGIPELIEDLSNPKKCRKLLERCFRADEF
jgi:hypothetical protein